MHLASQPLLAKPGASRLAAVGGPPLAASASKWGIKPTHQLEQCLSELANKIIAWAALREPLPVRDGAADALQRMRMAPPSSISGRLDLVSRWWDRSHVYLACAFLGRLNAGQAAWISRAQDCLGGDRIPSMTALALLTTIGAASSARGDAVRCMRVERLLKHLREAPEPVGSAVLAALGDPAG